MIAKALRRSGWLLLVGLALVVTMVTRAAAQDAAAVSPNIVKVKLDNDRVRVLEAISNPGDREDWHSHPATVVYVVSGGKLRISTRDGKSSDVEFKTGDVLYRPPVTHSGVNIGTTQLHVIIVELKGQ